MIQPGENRMMHAEANRALMPGDDGPDPRNVAAVMEWDMGRQAPVLVTRNFEERCAFGGGDSTVMPDGSRFVQAVRHFPPDAFTVGEIRRGQLRDVRVISSREVVQGSFRIVTRGQVLTWAQAVSFGIVGEG